MVSSCHPHPPLYLRFIVVKILILFSSRSYLRCNPFLCSLYFLAWVLVHISLSIPCLFSIPVQISWSFPFHDFIFKHYLTYLHWFLLSIFVPIPFLWRFLSYTCPPSLIWSSFSYSFSCYPESLPDIALVVIILTFLVLFFMHFFPLDSCPRCRFSEFPSLCRYYHYLLPPSHWFVPLTHSRVFVFKLSFSFSCPHLHLVFHFVLPIHINPLCPNHVLVFICLRIFESIYIPITLFINSHDSKNSHNSVPFFLCSCCLLVIHILLYIYVLL